MGFCLGIPFPSGLSALSQKQEEILPWAWGVNGALSVTGSVLTRLISMSAGFTVVLACVAALYIAAGFLHPAGARGDAAVGARPRAVRSARAVGVPTRAMDLASARRGSCRWPPAFGLVQHVVVETLHRETVRSFPPQRRWISCTSRRETILSSVP